MIRKRFSIGKALIYLMVTMLCASIVIAFWHLLNLSLSPSHIATRGGLLLYPKEPTLDNYGRVIGNRYIWMGYKNTLIRTAIGTVLQLFITSMGAYVLSNIDASIARPFVLTYLASIGVYLLYRAWRGKVEPPPPMLRPL